ncbi:MAG TPA: hypothetical protein VFN23_18510 [Ktedonobacteraceae bacterium]|nr:hypothetical protein [Ktedonobacteraceae bacterium]
MSIEYPPIEDRVAALEQLVSVLAARIVELSRKTDANHVVAMGVLNAVTKGQNAQQEAMEKLTGVVDEHTELLKEVIANQNAQRQMIEALAQGQGQLLAILQGKPKIND